METRPSLLRHVTHTVVRTITQCVHRVLCRMSDYRKRQAAYREFAALDERQLEDIGLTPNDFDAVISGTFFHNPAHRSRQRPTFKDEENATVSWKERLRVGVRPGSLGL